MPLETKLPVTSSKVGNENSLYKVGTEFLGSRVFLTMPIMGPKYICELDDTLIFALKVGKIGQIFWLLQYFAEMTLIPK